MDRVSSLRARSGAAARLVSDEQWEIHCKQYTEERTKAPALDICLELGAHTYPILRYVLRRKPGLPGVRLEDHSARYTENRTFDPSACMTF